MSKEKLLEIFEQLSEGEIDLVLSVASAVSDQGHTLADFARFQELPHPIQIKFVADVVSQLDTIFTAHAIGSMPQSEAQVDVIGENKPSLVRVSGGTTTPLTMTRPHEQLSQPEGLVLRLNGGETKEEILCQISKLFVEARRSTGLTQAALGKRIAGSLATNLGKYETAKVNPSIEKIAQFAEATGCRVEIRFIPKP